MAMKAIFFKILFCISVNSFGAKTKFHSRQNHSYTLKWMLCCNCLGVFVYIFFVSLSLHFLDHTLCLICALYLHLVYEMHITSHHITHLFDEVSPNISLCMCMRFIWHSNLLLHFRIGCIFYIHSGFIFLADFF